jgi:hypothetical protein
MKHDIVSRPNRPNPDLCCEACVYGKGKHAEWCPKDPGARQKRMRDLWAEYYRTNEVRTQRLMDLVGDYDDEVDNTTTSVIP